MLTLLSPSKPSRGITSVEPWTASGKACLRAVQSSVRCDAIVMGLTNSQSSGPDELLAIHDFNSSAVNGWLKEGSAVAKLGKADSGTTIATLPAQKGVPPWLSDRHGLVVIQPEPHRPGRAWWLVLGRDRAPFSATERELTAVLLQRWQYRFALADEPGLGRILLGHDDRVIGCDLSVREQFIRNPDMLNEVVSNVHSIAGQRYPSLDENAHDFVVHVGGANRWITFRRRSLLQGPQAVQWYLELRPVADDELPPVGTVEDERIAAALAFMHDRYAESPSLMTVSKKAHMSPFHFHRMFSMMVGTTPKQYLLRRQMQLAKWMLRTQRVDIATIAENTGFSSHAHFTSTFTRLIGKTPSDFRDVQA